MAPSLAIEREKRGETKYTERKCVNFFLVCAQIGTEFSEEYLWALSLKTCTAMPEIVYAFTGQEYQSTLVKQTSKY